jgi:hypothetical protein
MSGCVQGQFLTTRGSIKVAGDRPVVRDIAMLEKPGVYVLYRDDLPYYIGQAKCLRGRLYNHSRRPGSKHDLFWNYFSAFVVEDERHRDQVEALLISAFPTANGAKPKLKGPHTSDRVRDVLVMDRSKVLLRGYKMRVNL